MAIPPETVQKLRRDDFMHQCCCTGKSHVEWHHNLQFGRKKVEEWWAILPLHPDVHANARNAELKSILDWAMLNRAPEGELDKYSKVIDYKDYKRHLNDLYGEFSPRNLRTVYENHFN